MIELLFYIFVIYIVFRLLSWFTAVIITKKGNPEKKDGASVNWKSKVHKKIFKPEDGEYVDFEEVDKKKK